MELTPSSGRILRLSRGWVWGAHLIGTDGSTARIDQSHPDAANADNSIRFPLTDLPFVAHWIRGLYSAEEWPSQRRFSDGTVLFMDPNPTPELRLCSTTDRSNAIVATLTLYEDDLVPLVEWLDELASEFGVDLVSQRRRRDALAESESRGQPASMPLEESTASPVQTPERTDLLNDQAEGDFSIGSAVIRNREVPESPAHRPDYGKVGDAPQNPQRPGPQIRRSWLRRLTESAGGALLTVAILAFVVWEFVVAYEPGMLANFITVIAVIVLAINGDRISSYWRRFYRAARSRLAGKREHVNNDT